MSLFLINNSDVFSVFDERDKFNKVCVAQFGMNNSMINVKSLTIIVSQYECNLEGSDILSVLDECDKFNKVCDSIWHQLLIFSLFIIHW